MIGIRFKIPNEYGKFIGQILNDIGYDNYVWRIVEEEIITSDNENLFDKDNYSNQEFVKLINDKSYYNIFANIQLYRKYDGEVISDFSDFINSSCILVLFITDNEFVDIYSKDTNFLRKIYENAKVNNFSNIKCVCEDDRKRNSFSAYTD